MADVNNFSFPKNKVELASLVKTKEELDEKAYRIAYARSAYKLYDDYTVFYDSDTVEVETEGTWSDGFRDYESESFPLEYLFLPENEAIELVIKDRKAEIEAAKESARKQEELAAKQEEEKERLEYERLKAKFG